MHNAMLGLFNLGGGEIILILFVLMLMGAGAVAVVLVALWLFAKQRNPPPAVPPVQPTNPMPPPRTCPRCGAPLPPDAPEGLCPRCVLGVGLATHTEAPGEFGAPGTKTPQPPLPPAEIAKHFPQLEILECLGRGGMGVVYKARQEKLNRLVALKILAPEKGADPKFTERFLREAQALARLSHPNIVTVHDFGEADGLYYLLMEYVDGVTLRQLLQTRRMPPEEALGIVPKICEALQFAHDQGVVHRDIKPENVLLDKQGRVKIADFGIAKLVGAEATRPALTEEQSVIGTPHYMAPEQVEKPQLVDHRADIYSLGVVFYEMLTGELPLGKFQPPSKKVQMDVRLDEVVLHALEKEPERRYQQASEVKTAVETIANTPEKRNEPAPIPVRVLRWRDLWIWDTSNVVALALVPMVISFALTGVLLPFWGKRALFLLLLWAVGLAFAAMYAFVGAKVRRLKAALPRPTGEVAEALMFRRPFQSPGLAVLHSDRLELIWITGTAITVRLEDITAVAEVRWFNGTRLWSKKGFVLEVVNGGRVGVAVAEPFARRWRTHLSRGRLPELTAKSEIQGPASGIEPRFSPTAIVGMVWAVAGAFLAVIAAGIGAIPNAVGQQSGLALLGSILMATVYLTAPFATTILGWIAMSQIRRSAGKLYGARLAMFDGLLFPLLALLTVLWFVWFSLLDWGFPLLQMLRIRNPSLAFSLIVWLPWLASSVSLCVWAAKRAGRAVNQTAGIAGQTPASAPERLLWKFAAATVVVLLCVTAFIYWAQQPRLLRQTYSSDSPDGRYSALAQTFHEMRVFSGDKTYYRFAVQGLGGAVFEQWKVPVPMAKLATGYTAMSVDEIVFDSTNRARIQWSTDSQRVSFSVRDIEVFAFNVATRSTSSQEGYPPERSVSRDDQLQPPGTHSEQAFGLVIERVLYSVAAQRQVKAEDLDTGREIEVPAQVQKGGEEQFFHWLAAQGADLLAFAHKQSGDLWAAPELASMEAAAWDRPAVADLLAALKSAPVGLERAEPDAKEGFVSYRVGTNAVFPLTFAFQTSAGGLGLLQITGFTDNPRGVRIRYKLAQVPAKTPQLDALLEADRARAVALFNDIEDFGHEFEAAFTAKNLAAAQTGTRRLLTLLTNFNSVVRGTGCEFPAALLSDVGKVQEALEEGDWDKVKQAARFNEAYAREFRRIGSQVVELARQQKQGAATSFGPVIERVIAGEGDANQRFIDLDTGKQFAAAEFFGPKAEPSPEETRKWWAQNGIDAVGDTSAANRGLVGFDMVAVQVAEAEWTGASPQRLDYWLTPTRPGTPAAMSAKGNLPVTYVFRTREGGRGLLQITGLADSPPGLKLRYKLVEAP